AGTAPKLAQRHRANAASAFSRLPISHVVADDVSNRGRGEREEMRAGLEVEVPLLDELQVRFVDEGRRIEHPARVPAASLPVREDTQLAVDQRIQLVEC